eukprot:11186237-Lingulodinium_polyedra.AAC.1
MPTHKGKTGSLSKTQYLHKRKTTASAPLCATQPENGAGEKKTTLPLASMVKIRLLADYALGFNLGSAWKRP